jgi:predicted kinase
MRRLPEDSILEEMLKKDAVTDQTIKRIARRIALFHKEAATEARVTGFGSPEVIKKNVDENFTQSKAQVSTTITEGLYGKIKDFSLAFLQDNEGLFRRRMAGGFIRDCHGDIHTEHISVGEEIDIFDCIEFNERFRFSDTIADLAFLSMDLDFRNRRDLSKTLDREYMKASGDGDGVKLLDFYKCYRAFIRGKVEGFKYSEPEVQAEDKAAAFINARHHYHLSGQYADGGFKPLLVIIRGLSGTGKSALAEMLSRATGAEVLSSDSVRKGLAGLKPDEHSYALFKEGIYTKEFTEKTYGELIRQGVENLKTDRTTVLDATFSKKAHIESAVKEALGAGTHSNLIHVFECTAPDDVITERVIKREEELKKTTRKPEPGRVVSDMRAEILKEQQRSYEKIDLPHTVIDTTKTSYLLETIKRIYS